MELENLLPFHGYTYNAFIKGAPTNGKITVESGNVYLCQNNIDGCSCKDKQGHNYSWDVSIGTEADLRRNNVTDFELFPLDIKYKDKTIEDPLPLFFFTKITPKIKKKFIQIYPELEEDFKDLESYDDGEDWYIGRWISNYCYESSPEFMIDEKECFIDHYDLELSDELSEEEIFEEIDTLGDFSNEVYAINCINQSQWDTVSKKLGYEWSPSDRWSDFKAETCIESSSKLYDSKAAYAKSEIISFANWMKLEGIIETKIVSKIVSETTLLIKNDTDLSILSQITGKQTKQKQLFKL